MTLETLAGHRCFGGTQAVYAHNSETVGGRMEFSVFRPPQAEAGPVPVLFWLSGLTCTWENFTVKAGAQRAAADHGLMIVAPDTSPRGFDFPGEHEAYDFGSGAGFYVDATREPWSRNYRMYSYVTRELPELIGAHFPADMARVGVFGHSMGGHGALVTALRNPGLFKSLSAFAPISAPMRCPWGQKAFEGYLGPDQSGWKAYDATELAATAEWSTPVLVDQGTADGFLEEQLKPEALRAAFNAAGIPIELRMQEGYDHSYYFMASFMDDHIAHHARQLAA